MDQQNTELFQPRAVSYIGAWAINALQFKVYGISADENDIPEKIVEQANLFTKNEVPPLVEQEGADNGLGFVIIHCGELGVSVLAHWWVQGSVLCQHIQRTLLNSDMPMNTENRPVIACVWELGLIDAEQKIWRETMMNEKPNPVAYLETLADLKVV